MASVNAMKANPVPEPDCIGKRKITGKLNWFYQNENSKESSIYIVYVTVSLHIYFTNEKFNELSKNVKIVAGWLYLLSW